MVKTINISMDAWLYEQVEANKGNNRSEYIRSLIIKGLGIKPIEKQE